MSLPKPIKDKEKERIKKTWQEFHHDCINKMFAEVDKNKIGWHEQIFEDIKKQRLAGKIATILSGDYTYQDCVDAANYLMAIGMFEKQREEDFVTFPPRDKLKKTDSKVKVEIDEDTFVKYLLVYEGINTEYYVLCDDGVYPIVQKEDTDVWRVMEV